jgi:hypothetical protein
MLTEEDKENVQNDAGSVGFRPARPFARSPHESQNVTLISLLLSVLVIAFLCEQAKQNVQQTGACFT